MKLFVIDKNNAKKYIREEASTKEELAAKIGGKFFLVDGQKFSIDDVIAEADLSNTLGGVVVGGLIGALLTPVTLGLLLTGALGGLIGNSADEEEEKKVNNFNRERIEKV